MEDNTEAIIRLAWCRRLRLADDALTGALDGPAILRSEADGEVMVVRLWHDTVVIGPGWLHDRTRDLDPAALADQHELLRRCDGHPVRLLGEATLAYTDSYVKIDGLSAIPVADDPSTVARLEGSCPPDDVTEVGLSALDHVFVTLDDRDQPTAGAGYDEWVHILGHVGVLTPPELRRSGFGTRAAALAVNDALDAGLVPQWRARTDNTASRRAAAALGLREVGSQTTLTVLAADPSV